MIFYRDLGQGPVILLIHGGFSDGPLTWGVQMQEMPKARRLLVLDRRGHGESPKEPRPYTIGGDAADALAVLEHAGVARCHVAGHSYGALVALELARLAPARVQSLHLVEPPYFSLVATAPYVKALIDLPIQLLSARELPAPEVTFRFFCTLMGEAAAQRLRTRPVWQALVREAGAEMDTEFPAQYPAQNVQGFVPPGPVTVYCGGQSHPGLRLAAQAVSAAIAGAQLIEFPTAGHDLQRLPEFTAALLKGTTTAG